MTQYKKLNDELTSIHHEYNTRAIRFRPSNWLSEAQSHQQGYAAEWRDKNYASDLTMYRYFISLTRARTWLEANLSSHNYSVQPECGVDPKYGPYIGWTVLFRKDADFDRFQVHMNDVSYLQAKRHGEPLIAVTHAIREGHDPAINAETRENVAGSLNALAAAGTQHTYTESDGRHEIHIPDQQQLGGEKEKLPPPKV